MKNFWLVSVLLLILPVASNAQLKIDLGVKGGLNVSGLALSSDGKLKGVSGQSVSYNNRTGFHAGAYASIKLGKFGIQPEIIYSSQGQNFTTPYNTNLNSSLNYINVPVIFKYYLVGGLNLQVGPQFGFLLSAKGDMVDKSSLGLVASGQDQKSYLSSTDFSLAFGAGLDLPLGINIGIRYNLGYTDINNKKAEDTSISYTPGFSKSTTNNQVLQLSIGYRLFKFGR